MGLGLLSKAEAERVIGRESKMNRGPFLRFFESPIDPTLVEDPTRLIDFLNSCDQLQRLLGRRDDRGYTLLHYAAERNQEESVKCLIVKGGEREGSPANAAKRGYVALDIVVTATNDALYVLRTRTSTLLTTIYISPDFHHIS